MEAGGAVLSTAVAGYSCGATIGSGTKFLANTQVDDAKGMANTTFAGFGAATAGLKVLTLGERKSSSA